MYKKLLAPLDGSELSECTLEHIRAVASGCQIPEVVLLHVIVPLEEEYQHYRHRGVSESMYHEEEKKAETYAKDYLAEVTARMKKEGIAVEAVTVRGKPDEQILDYANKNEVDLIIMSTHGRSGASRWAFGSVTDRVLRHSPIPVLTVAPPGCRIS